MKKLTTVILSAFYAVSTILGMASFAPVLVRAHDGHDHKEVAAAEAPKAENKEVTYKYVAQPGDSYSKIARKAIQTYGLKNKLKLSQAKIIAAETWLTQEANSPLLNVGQNVNVNESAVKAVVDKASKLTQTQENRWKAYTVGVNFNTDAVGQIAR